MKWKAARQGVETDDTERVDVAPRVNRVTACLFRAHELQGSDHVPARGGRAAQVTASAACVSDPEVGEQRPSRGGIEQDVVGLHVAMDNAARVRVIERLADI